MIVSKLRTRGIQTPNLMLCDNSLEQVAEYKYSLGVTITNNLSWSNHISTISSKACKLTGMLYRHFYPWSNPEALYKLYISLIRPRLEYAAPVWTPHLSKNVDKLKAVQKFAHKMCSKDWKANYPDLLDHHQTPMHSQYTKAVFKPEPSI